jgi:hypothetical protein
MKEKAHPNLQENYFQIIDSKDKAYNLGFIFADGCICNTRHHNLTIEINKKDIEILYKMCDDLGANKEKIKYRTRITNKAYEHASCMCNIRINGKQFVSHLTNLGCVQRKSYKKIHLPILLNRELQLAFLLGFYDGDGTAHDGSFVCSSRPFVANIKKYFSIKNKILKRDTVYCLAIGTKLVNEMLDNYDRSLQRKRKYFPGLEPIKRIPKSRLLRLIKSHTLVEISKTLGVHEVSVQNWCKHYGIVIRPKHNISKEFLEQEVKHKFLKQIATEQHASEAYICLLCKKLGVNVSRKRSKVLL